MAQAQLALERIWEDFESHMLNEGVTKRRIGKLQAMHNVIARTLDVPLHTASRQHLEDYISKLHRNKILNRKGEPFSGYTKSDIKKYLKQFFKWYKGNNEFYPPEVSWIKTKISKDERPDDKPVLNLEELYKVANSMIKRPDYRAITYFLYDSGFRITEMLSVKKRDVTWDEYDKGQSCYWVRCNESKTETRTIPIPLFTEEINLWMNSSQVKTLSDDDLLFKSVSQPLYRNSLKDASKRILGKKVTPHALRHSSASYYAKELDGNLFALCQRYGWSFSSEEAKTYVRKSGSFQKQQARVYNRNKLAELEQENAEMRKQMRELTGLVKGLLSDTKKTINHIDESNKDNPEYQRGKRDVQKLSASNTSS